MAAPILAALAGSMAGAETDLETPAGPHINLSAGDFADARTFSSREVVLVTTYFYWYDSNTGENWVYADGSTTLTHHPVDDEDYSYRSVDWHKRQLRGIAAAGIDVVLPVFWGDPTRKAPWSFEGLEALAQAQLELLAAGEEVPRIGMFHAAISLSWGPDGKVDLTEPFGHQWFYATIRDFWSMVPPSRWAMVDGKPLIFLYSASFAADHDQSCIDFVRREFTRNFGGREPYIVRGDGWNVETESQYGWGGAVGPKLRHTAAIGPGYDHSAVQGREPLVVDREDGRFYRRAWETLLRMRPETRPRIVHIETWNELHEATEICETVECGRLYIDLTREYGKRYRAGEQIPRTGRYAAVQRVECDLGSDASEGLRHLPEVGDGPTTPGERGGRACRIGQQNPYASFGYFYFGLDDSFAFDEWGERFTIQVTYLDAGEGSLCLQYDSTDPDGSVADGAFKDAGCVELRDSGRWRTHAFRIRDARFLNRTHGGDFRLAAMAESLAVAHVSVTRR